MYILSKTELNNILSDDDIKIATHFFNNYKDYNNKICCNAEYIYLKYDDIIKFNDEKFSVIIKILKSNIMHFLLYSHNTTELKENHTDLYDYIYKNININKINITSSIKIKDINT